MESKNDKNTWYVKILRLLKLETTTKSGRVNMAGVFILAIFCIVYTTQDAFMHLISATEDTIKSVALKADIYHPYESDSVVMAVMPIFIGFLCCLGFLYVDDRKKNEMKKDEADEVENPMDKL